MTQIREYKGWIIQRDGPRDTPWTAWKPGTIRRRADTLSGIKQMIRDAAPIEDRWQRPEYEVLCVIGYDGCVQQIARLEHKGRSVWRTRSIAERHAREYTAAHGCDAYVSEC